jgi:hypothetical protein
MTVFTVYTPPKTGDRVPHEEAVFIPDAKALLALVFPFIWLLWHRLWWAVLFYALLSIILTMTLTLEIGLLASFLTFVPGFYLFLEGNELRRKALERRGWGFGGVIEGEDQEEAEIRHFNSIHNAAIEPEKTVTLKPRKPALVVDPGINLFAGPERA